MLKNLTCFSDTFYICLQHHAGVLNGEVKIQSNFSGSNTDGSFTTAVSNSFSSP